MKRLRLLKLILWTVLLGFQVTYAQNNKDSILVNVAGEKYTASQLLDLYKKASQNSSAKFDKADFKNYLDLFINFKLKIKEAEKLGLDTLKKFRDEYSVYDYQVTEPYLTDDSCMNALANMYYNRSKTNVRASHILFKIELEDPDSVKVYKRAMDIRKKALKGEDFEKLAVEYSEDPSAVPQKDPRTGSIMNGNGGDLGYFTVLDMELPFEDAIYNMAVGEISMPVRTRYGYHIIKKTGALDSWGNTKLKHVWIGVDEKEDSSMAYSKIMMAYENLEGGRFFDEVARNYSQDANTSTKGGLLPSMLPNQMPPDYLEKAAKLREGEYSSPFRTKFGYHIILVMEKSSVPPFETIESSFKRKISYTNRIEIVNDCFMRKAGKEYGLKEDRKGLETIKNLMNDSINTKTWDYPKTIDLSKALFVIDGKSCTQKDLAENIKMSQGDVYTSSILSYRVDMKYRSLLLKACKEAVKSHLGEKYPDIKQTLQNYREGLLIFDINEKMVWLKSILDTAGLEKFYNDTKNSHFVKFSHGAQLKEEDNYYMWNERADVTIWKFENKCIAPDKAVNIMNKGFKEKLADSEIFDLLNAKVNKNADATKDIQFSWGKYEKDGLESFSKIDWKEGVSKAIPMENDSYEIFLIHKILPPELKSLDEAKGYYTNNYQEYLEKEWIKSLRAKYPYSINTQLLETLR